MNVRFQFTPTILAALCMWQLGAAAQAAPLGTAFTYQGQLKDGGSPADGPHEFEFSLWDDPNTGTQFGPSLTFDGIGANPPPIDVIDGLFTVELDFGAAAFSGDARWLKIVVNGVPLSPRQRIAATPHALQTRGIHVDSTGKIGIGTMTPQDQLTVDTSTDSYGISHTDGTISLCTYVGGVQLGGWLGTRSLHSLHFFTGNSFAQMTLNSLGNVGIGTVSPTHRLTINSPTISALRLIGPFTQFGYGARLNFGDSNLAYIEEDEDDTLQYRASRHALMAGFVGINTTAPSQRLHVAGNICATGTIGACSDERFKERVESVAGALDKVEQLRGVNFVWKREAFPDHQFAENRQLGFIAQEVEKVLPQVVSRGSDGYLSVDYGRLTPVLVEAMKELRQANERLHTEKDSEIAAQQATIESLAARIDRLERLIQDINTNGEGEKR